MELKCGKSRTCFKIYKESDIGLDFKDVEGMNQDEDPLIDSC